MLPFHRANFIGALPPSTTVRLELQLINTTANNSTNGTNSTASSGVLAAEWTNQSYAHRVTISVSWTAIETFGAPLLGYQLYQTCGSAPGSLLGSKCNRLPW